MIELLIASAVLAAGLAGPAPDVPPEAHAESAFDDGKARVYGDLIADVEQVTPGDTFRAGVLFRMDPDWHIYWKNPGDAAIPTALDLESLQGDVGSLRWPMPQIFRESQGFITTYGYAGEVLLFAPIEVTETDGVLELSARADFLACKVECVPGDLELTRTIPIGAATIPSPDQARFDRNAKTVPSSAEASRLKVDPRLSHTHIGPEQGFRVWFQISCHQCSTLELGAPLADAFVPLASTAFRDIELKRILPNPDAPGLVLELSARSAGPRSVATERLAGVVSLVSDGEPRNISVSADVPTGATPGTVIDSPYRAVGDPSESSDSMSLGLWQIGILALLGGMLLNLMPCVLPVLAIKLVSFTELAHRDKRAQLVHSGAYAFAVVLSMALLALTVIVLKAAGASIGWGFQFQSPVFLTAIGALLIAFALNLFGVFEVAVSATSLGHVADRSSGVRRSFFEGVLAVVLATPCTAPLLGTAVGFALAQSAWVVMLVFVLIGVGLAAPFVALTLVPGWAKRMPKPGPWMVNLKHLLAFTLLGSAAWLLWVLGRGYGVDAMGQVLVLWVCVAVAVWIAGLGQRTSGRARGFSLAIAFALVALSGAWLLPAALAPETEATVEWARYDREAIRQELASGRAVFVNFTADWCITCKVNERTVLSRPGVHSAAVENNIALYKADWTRPDQDIEAALAAYGKAGVPAYVVYSPHDPERPQILPELLTPQLLRDAFADARATADPR